MTPNENQSRRNFGEEEIPTQLKELADLGRLGEEDKYKRN
jgi:hypothetical protein